MKKQLLLAGLAGMFMSAVASDGATQGVRKYNPVTRPVKVVNAPQFRSVSVENATSRSSRALQKTEIGTSGNLIGVARSTSNAVDANDSINAVTFIYRADSLVNLSRFKFSVSKDGGSSWVTENGFLNPSHTYSNPPQASDTNSRYPQGAIYRAPGGSNPDSAYIIYTGTWHSAGIWSGETRGVGQLSGDNSTYTAQADLVAGGAVAISNSLITVGNKIFAIQEQLDAPSAGAGTTVGTVLIRGVWNEATKNVTWTETIFPHEFDFSSSSLYFNPTVAFDPTGQIGYIVATGDITPNDGILENKPFFYKTTDGGDTWTETPERIDLDAITGFLKPALLDPNSGDTIPTSINVSPYGSMDLVVDYLGNPHIGIVVWLSNVEDYGTYYPFYYGFSLFDLTWGTLCDGSNGWVANHIKELHSTFTSYPYIIGEEGADVKHTDNNRLQASRSADGKYVFFFWGESDSAMAVPFLENGDPDNPSPDLLGIGIDVENKKATSVKNFTAGDPVFGGATSLEPFNGGSAGGASFALVSPNTLKTAGGFRVPITLTEADYNNQNPTSGVLKNSSNPSKNYYLQNIEFALSEFTLEASDLEPPLFAGVPDTVFVHLDSTFVSPSGVTAVDCHDGDVTANISTSNDVNPNEVGSYTLTYTVSDSAGNTATVTVPVLVQTEPVAIIAYTQITGNRYQFRDSSLNLPTYRRWTFSNGSAASTETTVTKTFSNSGTVEVCLYVSNSFGNDQTCEDFLVSVGIDDVEMAKAISVFPTSSANGRFTVTTSNVSANDLVISTYDMKGTKVAEDNVIKANTAFTEFTLSNLAGGVYQLKIGNDKDGYTVKPVIIQK